MSLKAVRKCTEPGQLPIFVRSIWMVTTVTPLKPFWLARLMRLADAWWRLPGAAAMRPSLLASQEQSSVLLGTPSGTHK